MNKIEIDGIVEREPRRFATQSGESGLGFSLLNQDQNRKLYISVTMWNPGPEVQLRQGDHVVVAGSLVNKKNKGPGGNDTWEKAITAYEIRNLNLEHANAPEFQEQAVRKMEMQPISKFEPALLTESDLPF